MDIGCDCSGCDCTVTAYPTPYPTAYPTAAPTTSTTPPATTSAATTISGTVYIPNQTTSQAPPTPAPTPAPTVKEGEVNATGDPHLVNVHGQHFDVMQPGVHVLLRIPFKARPLEEFVLVTADAQRIGDACADTYFMAINMTGTWVADKINKMGVVGGHGLFFSAGAKAPHTGTPWMSFGKVWLKVRYGRTSTGTAYLNFFVRNLKHAGHLVGGLLGEDDHTEVETIDAVCRKTMSL